MSTGRSKKALEEEDLEEQLRRFMRNKENWVDAETPPCVTYARDAFKTEREVAPVQVEMTRWRALRDYGTTADGEFYNVSNYAAGQLQASERTLERLLWRIKCLQQLAAGDPKGRLVKETGLSVDACLDVAAQGRIEEALKVFDMIDKDESFERSMTPEMADWGREQAKRAQVTSYTFTEGAPSLDFLLSVFQYKEALLRLKRPTAAHKVNQEGVGDKGPSGSGDSAAVAASSSGTEEIDEEDDQE